MYQLQEQLRLFLDCWRKVIDELHAVIYCYKAGGHKLPEEPQAMPMLAAQIACGCLNLPLGMRLYGSIHAKGRRRVYKI